MASGSQNMTTYKAKQLVNTYGSDTTPVYINAGVPTILGTIGANNKPVWVNAGVISTLTTIGDTTKPVWVNNGVITEMTAGTTAQFYRGDKAWSNDLVGRLTVDGLSTSADIIFDATGTTGTSAKITWSGSTDAADIYYYVPSSDQGNLVINTRDDTNCLVAFAYNGTIKAYINNSTPCFYPATNNVGNLGGSSNEWSTTYTRQIYARHFDASANFTNDRDMYYGYQRGGSHYFYSYDGTTRTHRATISATGLLINQPATNRNAGIIGTYDYTKAALIWSMGASYNIAANGSGLGSLYGAAYAYQGQTCIGGKTLAGGHQFLWCENGGIDVALGSNGVWIKKNGGIYWDPYVESASDASDVTSIYQIASGVAGGTELRINQQNDAAGCINLCTNSYIYLNSKRAFTINDSWLRINENAGFSSGTYFGSTTVRTDGTLQVGSGGNKFYANSSGHTYVNSTLSVGIDSTSYNLYVNGTGRFDNQVLISNYAADRGDVYSGSIQLREYRYQTTSCTENWYNAPGITFHWGGRYVSKLGMYKSLLRIDSVQILTANTGLPRYHVGSTANNSYILVTINPETSWMISFTLRLYQSYTATDIQISGYNYGSNHWYSPQSRIIASTTTGAIKVYFGYTANWKLWVAVDGGSYNGADVFNVCNGYTQIDPEGAFTVTKQNSLPGTTQTTQTIYRPYYRDETVANATTSASCSGNAATATTATKLGTDAGNSNTPVYFSGGKPVSTNNKLGAVYANGYWGMRGADNGDSWIRTTSSGIIPVQSGGAGNGHCGIGTSSWYFSYMYADNFYGKFNGNCTGTAGGVAWGNITGRPTLGPIVSQSAHIVGKTVTINLSGYCSTGSAYGFLVVANSWVVMSNNTGVAVIAGLQRGTGYGSAVQIVNETYGVSVSFNNANGKATLTFYDSNGGGYAIMQLYG